jgi:hypothetical protein
MILIDSGRLQLNEVINLLSTWESSSWDVQECHSWYHALSSRYLPPYPQWDFVLLQFLTGFKRSAFVVFEEFWRRGTLPWDTIIVVEMCMSKSASKSGVGVRLWIDSGGDRSPSATFLPGSPLERGMTSVDFSKIVSFDDNQENWYEKPQLGAHFGSFSSRFLAYAVFAG